MASGKLPLPAGLAQTDLSQLLAFCEDHQILKFLLHQDWDLM
jgi:hypothetical protein